MQRQRALFPPSQKWLFTVVRFASEDQRKTPRVVFVLSFFLSFEKGSFQGLVKLYRQPRSDEVKLVVFAKI